MGVGVWVCDGVFDGCGVGVMVRDGVFDGCGVGVMVRDGVIDACGVAVTVCVTVVVVELVHPVMAAAAIAAAAVP